MVRRGLQRASSSESKPRQALLRALSMPSSVRFPTGYHKRARGRCSRDSSSRIESGEPRFGGAGFEMRAERLDE